MGFLDELKKEAEQVKQREQESRSATDLERERVLRSIRPRMQKVHDYLKEACEQLNVLDPDVHMSYEVKGFGKLGPLRQGGYKVVAEEPRKLEKFTLSFACSRPDQVRFQVQGKERALAQKEYMWGANLRFTSKVTADGSGVFFMDAYVPVTLEFEADMENARINLRIRNLDGLGSSRIVYEPDVLDDELLEELAKCIVRQDNRFQDLSGNTVSKEMRMRLQQQLQYDAYKRQLEASLEGGESDATAVKKKKGLLRSLFGN